MDAPSEGLPSDWFVLAGYVRACTCTCVPAPTVRIRAYSQACRTEAMLIVLVPSDLKPKNYILFQQRPHVQALSGLDAEDVRVSIYSSCWKTECGSFCFPVKCDTKHIEENSMDILACTEGGVSSAPKVPDPPFLIGLQTTP